MQAMTRLSCSSNKNIFVLLGMGLYLDTFKQNVEAQGENSILFLRNELSSFYGTTNFLEHLDIIGSKAVRRSKIHGRRREKKMSSAMAYIGKVRYFIYLFLPSLSSCHRPLIMSDFQYAILLCFSHLSNIL